MTGRRSAAIRMVLLAALSGCGGGTGPSGSAEPNEAVGLRNLGTMYKIAGETLKRPPKTLEELLKAESQVPGGFSDIGETNVAVYFGVDLSGGAPADAVLAYDRLTPHQGGYVLLVDGSVKKLTADEFKAAKKAGAKPWTAAPGS